MEGEVRRCFRQSSLEHATQLRCIEDQHPLSIYSLINHRRFPIRGLVCDNREYIGGSKHVENDLYM